MFANFSFEHPTNSYGKTVFVRSCIVPWHVLIKAELPSVEFVLLVGVPKPVDARGECNGSLDALILWKRDDVGAS